MIERVTLLFQYASSAMFLAVFVATMWGVRRQPQRWIMYLPVVVFAATGLAFYGLAFGGVLSADGFILLGAAHRAIGALLIFVLVIVVVLQDVDE